MFASLATPSPAGGRTVALTPGSLTPDRLLPWAAFRLLCHWTLSTPAALARRLGADGFDAGFGLDDGDR